MNEHTTPPFNPELVDSHQSDFRIERQDLEGKELVIGSRTGTWADDPLYEVNVSPISIRFSGGRPQALPSGSITLRYRSYYGYDDGSGERGPGNWIESKYTRELTCSIEN